MEIQNKNLTNIYMDNKNKYISPYLLKQNPPRELEVKSTTIYKQLREGKITEKDINKMLFDNYDNLIYNPVSKRITTKKTFNKSFNKGLISRVQIENQLPSDKLFNPITKRIVKATESNVDKIDKRIQKFESQQQNNITFPELNDSVKSKLNNLKKPFTLNLNSSTSNAKHNLTFKNYYEFKVWFDKINNDINTDSDEIRNKLNILQQTKSDLFSVVNFTITQGGGHDTHKKRDRQLKSPYYEFEVYSPYDNKTQNNCGFKCIEYLTNKELNYLQERKSMNIPTKIMLTEPQLLQFFKKHYDKEVIIIEKDYDGELKKDTQYIILNNNHYFVVKTFKYKDKKNVKTKRGELYFDIETRPNLNEPVYLGESKGYKLKDAILVCYYRCYKSNEWNKKVFNTDINLSSARKFLNWLTVMGDLKKYFNIVAHNGSRFDNFFLVGELTEQESEFTEIQLRGTSIIGMQYKSHLFKDSCCFMTNSLDNLCKAFKIKCPKLKEFEYQGKILSNMELCFYKPQLDIYEFMELEKQEPEFWDLYVEYCFIDCVSLSQIWNTFIKECNSILTEMRKDILKSCNATSCNTIGALSIKILNKLNKGKDVYKDLEKFIDSREKYDFMVMFKRGGISHCNKAGKHTLSTISFDITSQYPTACVNMKIPVGESKFITYYNGNGFYHLKNLKFKNTKNFKPVANKNDNGILEWLTGNNIKEVCIDSCMIEYLQDNYGLYDFEVIQGLTSDICISGDELFGKYVDTLFQSKAQQDIYKDNNDEKYNPALREVIKLLLNSLTGKLVEDTSKYFKYEWTDFEGQTEDEIEKLKEELKDSSDVKQINNIYVNKKKDKERYNIWLTAGVMVYSYSKRLLFEYIKALPNDSDDVIHVETDSIYFHKKNEETFRKNINDYKGDYPVCIGDTLGSVKVEKDTSEESYFLGKKFYYIAGNCLIKGIPKTTLNDDGSTKILVDKSIYEEVYNWKQGDAPIKREYMTMKKQLFGSSTEVQSFRQSRTINPTPDKYKLYE